MIALTPNLSFFSTIEESGSTASVFYENGYSLLRVYVCLLFDKKRMGKSLTRFTFFFSVLCVL